MEIYLRGMYLVLLNVKCLRMHQVLIVILSSWDVSNVVNMNGMFLMQLVSMLIYLLGMSLM